MNTISPALIDRKVIDIVEYIEYTERKDIKK
jgi:hypothetical protein